jgi:hypothetical protein
MVIVKHCSTAPAQCGGGRAVHESFRIWELESCALVEAPLPPRNKKALAAFRRCPGLLVGGHEECSSFSFASEPDRMPRLRQRNAADPRAVPGDPDDLALAAPCGGSPVSHEIFRV